MYNIVTVTFKDSNTATANGVRQWDYGQILRIQGLQLPTAVEVHFALIDSKDSVTRIGITKDGVTDVVIPDSMIEAGKNIFAYVYLRDSESGQTEYEIKIVVTTRAKPEAFDTPEDKELFAQAIEAVNEAADRAEKAGQAATEAAGQAAEDAQQTAEDRKEVAKMVETVSDISEQVKKVEELSNKAQESATQAGTSATAAEKAKAQAETAAGKTAEDRTAVNQAKIAVDEAQKAVRADRAAVEEAKQSVEQLSNAIPESTQVGVQAVNQARQTAVDEIARTGTSHKTAVEGAGTQAVESVENVQQVATEAVETAKTEAVQAVQAEGAKQIKEVRDKGAEVLQSIPEDFQTQMETKLNKQQGIENKGKVLVIGEDGNVVPEEVASGGGDGIAIINTMSGESPLVIPDSAERVNKRLELGGKTEQVTTTGKNLFDSNIAKNKENYKEVTIAGSVIYAIELSLKPNTKYAFQCVIKSVHTTMNVGNSTIRYVVSDGQKRVITTNEDGKLYIGFSGNPDGEIHKIGVSIVDIQVEESTTVTPYEPYTGGKPSPSPEYPQEIKSVGKWNDEKQKYEVDVKVTGRNLFNGKLLKGKFITDDMNVVSDLVTMNTFDKPVEIEPNTDYVISANGVIWEGNINVYDENGKKIVQHFTGKFKTPSNAKYIRASISNARAPIDSKIQMEYGTAMNEFEQYHQPQTLTLTSDRPITKWDRLVEQGGQIGWLYQSSKMILDGTKIKWLHSNKPENSYFATTIIDAYGGKGASFCKTYRNIQDSAYVIKYANERCIYSDHPTYTSGDKFFGAPNENVTTLEQWKEFIDENPIEMLYHTKNSEFVPLPQSEQNAIRALKAYYPTTVITADGGELDPDIKVTYTADTKNYIDGKVSAKVASILRQYQADTANLLSLMPMETQATMIENDTNNILNNLESEEAHE